MSKLKPMIRTASIFVKSKIRIWSQFVLFKLALMIFRKYIFWILVKFFYFFFFRGENVPDKSISPETYLEPLFGESAIFLQSWFYGICHQIKTRKRVSYVLIQLWVFIYKCYSNPLTYINIGCKFDANVLFKPNLHSMAITCFQSRSVVNHDDASAPCCALFSFLAHIELRFSRNCCMR